ncbi:hypothetical protein [Dokdonella sp.]|uniref:hypothetical protein n=1 Tax=Dokdonella sp. TaxID=2291710 RepID=UPI001B1D58A1|nr:hypothetical protein [Dokdonella sp.]MBO9663260.1 hypothetical protein [Dokdonella sp.]
MKRIILLLLLMLPVSSMAKTVNYGGFNYFVYDMGAIIENPNGPTYPNIPCGQQPPNISWKCPPLQFKNLIGLLNSNPQFVYSRLQAMRQSGQNALVLPIYNMALSGSVDGVDGVDDGVYGEILDNHLGHLWPQHSANLSQILTWAQQLGYKSLVVRFFYNNKPREWTAWNESSYQSFWSYVKSIHDLVSPAVGQSLTVSYDLGAEWGGITGGQLPAFKTKLWSDYTARYGKNDTVGFSVAMDPQNAPSRFSDAIAEYGANKPNVWALDIYSSPGYSFLQRLQLAYNNLSVYGLQNQPIVVLETFFNNQAVSQQLSSALGSLPALNITGIYEWPLIEGQYGVQSALNQLPSSNQFSNYRGFIGQRTVSITSTNANISYLSDTNCGSSSTPSCTVHQVYSAPPAGKVVHVTVDVGNGPSSVSCWNRAGYNDPSWIVMNKTYQFKIYYKNDCVADYAGLQPVAVSTVIVK